MNHTAANTFVEGDNLEVLTRLAPGSFDLISIDPPYNTGNVFAYRDDFRGERGAGLAGRHTAWLDFMAPRLVQGHRVLAETGAIFVSIDDHEVTHLRLLLDQIYGEENFLAQIVVNLNAKGRQLGTGFAISHEYLLVYAKDRKRCVLDASTTTTVMETDFPLVAEDGRRYRRLPLRNTNKKFNPRSAPTLHFAIWGDPVAGRVAAGPFVDALEIMPVFGDGSPAVWRWSAPRIAERAEDLECRVVRGRDGERVDVFQRDWRHRVGGRRKKMRTIWLAEEVGTTDTAVAELKALLGHAGGGVFESPKPTGLLLRILETMPSSARVLDYFAGSGTTGHAVALANAADQGRRTCLSINAPEPTHADSNAARLGYPCVSAVTRARLKAVAEQVGGGFVEIS
ncbi:MAG: site-specific DNA-methyltransferase [Nocardioidaceae bacterium]|nr:site-specific DNA-methyltransferase [Nocardioidaceae bacterium]